MAKLIWLCDCKTEENKDNKNLLFPAKHIVPINEEEKCIYCNHYAISQKVPDDFDAFKKIKKYKTQFAKQLDYDENFDEKFTYFG